MLKRPIVSVVITVFNQEKFIKESVQSVTNQSFTDWECIIVDDGSSDNTLNICQQLAANDRRIRIISQTNRGVASARNYGFEHSSGVFIQFLDGDDFIMPEKLMVQAEFLISNPQYGVVYSNHQHYWQSSGSFAQYSFEILEEYPLHQFLFRYDRGVSIPIHTALLRRSIWDDNELPFPVDYIHRYEDWVFWVKNALKNIRFRFIDQNLAVYRMHADNFVTGAEPMAVHALHAINYINSQIPLELREDFQNQGFNFVLKRYVDSKIQNLTFSFHIKQIISVPGLFLRKVKIHTWKMIKRVRK